jgi:hypothetical protein
VVPHLLKPHVGEAQLAGVVLLQGVQLARAAISSRLMAVRLSMEGAHIFDEAARDRGRQFYLFEGHGPGYRHRPQDCETRGSGLSSFLNRQERSKCLGRGRTLGGRMTRVLANLTPPRSHNRDGDFFVSGE